MVTLNFTLVVELLLFLLFLWGTARFIVRPVIRMLDDRDRSVEQNLTRADADNAEADDLHQRYTGTMTEVRRWVEAEFRVARQRARDRQAARITEAKRKGDSEVARTREEARQRFESERSALDRDVPELASSIGDRLGLRERTP